MSNQSRKARGMRTQALVAEWFQTRGYPYATDAGAGRPGRDVLNTPGLSIEVKARTGFNPQAWLRQAEGAAKGAELPVAIFRPNGMGEASIGKWGCLLTLQEFTDLIVMAGIPARGV